MGKSRISRPQASKKNKSPKKHPKSPPTPPQEPRSQGPPPPPLAPIDLLVTPLSRPPAKTGAPLPNPRPILPSAPRPPSQCPQRQEDIHAEPERLPQKQRRKVTEMVQLALPSAWAPITQTVPKAAEEYSILLNTTKRESNGKDLADNNTMEIARFWEEKDTWPTQIQTSRGSTAEATRSNSQNSKDRRPQSSRESNVPTPDSGPATAPTTTQMYGSNPAISETTKLHGSAPPKPTPSGSGIWRSLPLG
ncbi:hypothetical protein DFH27DRAFT_616688 [Peziza echinospora]|nr:hypothetical protein DFH27DRAFT_616688 [Peziza echinospora]